MKYRTLGMTGLKVSEVSLGAWALGGAYKVAGKAVGYGPLDEAEGIRCIQKAADLGINLLDTAPTYGVDGASEKLIAKAIAGRRDQWILSTKAGNKQLPDTSRVTCHERDFIVNTLEGSLKRLKTDHVELFFLHNPVVERAVHVDDVFATLEDLRQQGKVLWYGASFEGADDGFALAAAGEMHVFMTNHNILQPKSGTRLAPLCRERNMGLILRGSLCQGLLTRQFGRDTVFAPEDMRSRITPDSLAAVCDRVDTIRSLMPKGYPSLEALAVRFCLADPAVGCVIAGAKTRTEIAESAAASDAPPLSDELMSKLKGLGVSIQSV